MAAEAQTCAISACAISTCAISIIANHHNAQKSIILSGRQLLRQSVWVLPGGLLSSLYICRESSTNSPRFMQNKPNLLNTQMNVNKVLTKDYENEARFRAGKTNPNKPNSNPISEMLKMNVGSVKTKDYENKRLCALRENKPKTNPIKPNFKGKKEKDFAPKPQGRDEKTNKKC